MTSNIKVDLAGTFRNIDTSNLNTGGHISKLAISGESLNTVITGDTADHVTSGWVKTNTVTDGVDITTSTT